MTRRIGRMMLWAMAGDRLVFRTSRLRFSTILFFVAGAFLQRADAQAVDTTGTSVYIVEEGDTFFELAARLGMSVAALGRINRVEGVLRTGDRLRVPTEKLAREYRVRSGDTLFEIARRFGVEVEAIRDASGLTGSNLQIGQIVHIPGQGVRGESAPEDLYPGRTAKGTAVVYPSEQIGRMLSSGRRYDPDRYTISHAEFGVGAIVLVRSSRNGRGSFAEVTDVGSDLAPGLVDVSRALADAIGLKESESETVEIILIDEGH